MTTRLSSVSKSLFIASLALPLIAACGDDEADHDHDHDVDASTSTPDAEPADAGPQAVAIQFAARVGGTAFACGQTYTGIGSAASDYVGAEFRFYVHDLALVPAGGGAPVPVTLDDDANQNAAAGLAMVDFEDGTAECQTGNAGTHTAITGTVPPGSYDGVVFKVGVPFALNHLDPTTAAPPLDATGMYWSWRAGYKFLRIDGVVGGNPFNVHLGSTGCTSATPETPPDTACVNPNIMDITLASFDPSADTIVADIGPVLATVDVSANTAATAPGCQSFPDDPECTFVFPLLGLAYQGTAAGSQALFTVE
ncbi:MAG: metallo-mystery pair system four-Cys motif protein [Kofleriaceae bacterium]|nr:metallo-mystery pair system four-Cys motif protein [Kofleriaceae bacterium]